MNTGTAEHPPGLKYIEHITVEGVNDGKPMPCYEMGEFINSLEGWKLFVECQNKQDMKPYHEALAAFKEAKLKRKVAGGE